MSSYREMFAQASTASEIHQLLVGAILDTLPITGMSVAPLAMASKSPDPLVLYVENDDSSQFEQLSLDGVNELLSLPNPPLLFNEPNRCLRLEEKLGWNQWLQSRIYNDYFRPQNAARQLVVGFTASTGAPRAFMALCRGEANEAFTREEERAILAIRDSAEQSLLAFELETNWAQPTELILDSLTRSLPIPALLVNRDTVVWMNHEAELRLGMLSLSFGTSETFLAGRCIALQELLHHVRIELNQPGASLGDMANQKYPWLVPGERIVVRRLEQGGLPDGALVCLMAPVPSLPLRKAGITQLCKNHGLTPREAEIVALAVQGYSMLGVASRLNIAESTVSTHLKRVYKKLGVRSRAELAWRIARGT